MKDGEGELMKVVVMYREWETQQVPIINRTGKHEALRMQHKSLPEKAMQDDHLIVKFSQKNLIKDIKFEDLRKNSRNFLR